MGKRLFIAVDLSPEARLLSAAFAKELQERFPASSVRWERPEKHHITLKFLGSVPETEIPGVRQAIKNVGEITQPFEVTLQGTGIFPDVKRPRVIWLGVSDGNHELAKIVKNLASALSTLSFPEEKRAFHPHYTIGRIKHSGDARRVAEHVASSKFGPVTWTVEEIMLYESILSPNGSIYRPVDRVSLLDAI